MIGAGTVIGVLMGIVIAIPANRLAGFYYALLTMVMVELCRVIVLQSDTLGSASGGLFGADSYIPDGLSNLHEQAYASVCAFVVLLLSLLLYRWVNDGRLGKLLRCAPDQQEAFAAACGIDYKHARTMVFLISSAALGAIGGFYAAHLRGASPAPFGMDNLMLMLAMIVIGGMGTARGAILGTLLVVAIDKLMLDLGTIRLVAVGLIMLASVLFTRQGLIGIPAQYRAWRAKSINHSPTTTRESR